MSETRLDWDNLALFLAVARSGGLTAAASETGRSAPTLSRRMRELERQWGEPLFTRHERGYELTEAGQLAFDHLASLESRIEQIRPATAERAMPVVSISAGTWTTWFLLQHAATLQGTPVDVRLKFISTEMRLNLLRRETAIGFRNQRPTEEGLAGRKLSHVQFAVFATDADCLDWIGVSSDTPSARWLTAHVQQPPHISVSSPRSALDLALMGVGKVILPTFVGKTLPELEQIGDSIDALAHDQWLVCHQDDRQLAETRRVIDRAYSLFDSVAT